MLDTNAREGRSGKGTARPRWYVCTIDDLFGFSTRDEPRGGGHELTASLNDTSRFSTVIACVPDASFSIRAAGSVDTATRHLRSHPPDFETGVVSVVRAGTRLPGSPFSGQPLVVAGVLPFPGGGVPSVGRGVCGDRVVAIGHLCQVSCPRRTDTSLPSPGRPAMAVGRDR